MTSDATYLIKTAEAYDVLCDSIKAVYIYDYV